MFVITMFHNNQNSGTRAWVDLKTFMEKIREFLDSTSMHGTKDIVTWSLNFVKTAKTTLEIESSGRVKPKFREALR